MPKKPELKDVVAVPLGEPRLAASDLEGWDISGCRRTLRLASPGRWTLLLFLGSHCDGCLPFWPAPRAPMAFGLEAQDRAVVVARGRDEEEPDVLRSLMGDGSGADRTKECELLLSADAWRTYRVHGPPFFVLLDGVEVVTEGVAWSAEQVAADVGRARRSAGGEAVPASRVRR